MKFQVKKKTTWKSDKRLHKKHSSLKRGCFIYPSIATIQKCLYGYITVKNDSYFQVMFAKNVLHRGEIKKMH